MRAIEVRRFGPPKVLEPVDAPEPVARRGELLVDVEFADTLWLETAVRSGRGEPFFPVELPYRPGVGVAGVVAGTRRRVVAGTGHTGGYAELAAVPAEALVAVPDDVPLDVAAALLHDGVTAMALAELVRVEPGARVLVTAAAGGLGALLLQLATAAGAEVTGAARGAAKLERVRALGARAVDYAADGWAAGVGEVDVVLDGAGGDYGRAAWSLVAPGGRFSAHGSPAGGFSEPDPEEAAARGVAVTGILDLRLPPDRAAALLARALAEAAAGRIAPLVGQRFPLERAAEAHAAIESRTAVGKTLLTL